MKEKAYQEACTFARHYSEASRSVRLLCVAQGIAVLTGAGYLARTAVYLPAALASLFGCLLAIMLFYSHRGYLGSCSSFYKTAAKLETELGLQEGPVTLFEADHAKRFRGWRQYVTTEGPFVFIAASCFALFCWALIKSL